jgi:hypothetical protein
VTLTLESEQPTETPEPTEAGPALSVIATVVTTNGVVVQIAERPDGALVLSPSGNRMPLVLDRFQRGAFVAALAEG